MEITDLLYSIVGDALNAPVRCILQEDRASVLHWQVEPMVGGVGNPVSAGLFRFQGVAQAGEEQRPWSLVLKAVQSPPDVAMQGTTSLASHYWNYWKRELYAYRSEILSSLPEGLAAPRCCGWAELPGERGWLWLEDIQDSYQGEWSLERFVLAARHLGRLNGAYCQPGSLPDEPWLGRDLLLQWIEAADVDLAPFCEIERWRSYWEHPLTRRRYPGAEDNAFYWMIRERGRFAHVLQRLPRTLCHGDTYPTNLMSRGLPGGEEQTVALDWGLLGIGPLGDDLGQLAFGAQDSPGDEDWHARLEALFAGYQAGLSDSICHPDPLLLRFGFAACAALRVGMYQLVMIQQAIESGEWYEGEPASQPPFEARLAEEAYRLLVDVENRVG
jgi:hypothetical protein